ncbi:TniB family NTP-binding protein [Chromobacterium subtsugae]|uniref:TniB family NTP-binding protein n=1 Tax=Chromobacterium subtsugae TaxID=251747 RepID=UPI000640BC0B|nr:TniB family NTP-binding protein [Chromobacterium subtsugae]
MSNFGLSALEEAAIERVATLDEVMIRHPAMDLALNGIQRCIAQSTQFKEPVGCMLLAEGGMGKSTVCRIIQASLPGGFIQTPDAEVTLVPAFHAEVPSPVSVNYLATNILAGLHDLNPNAGTIPAKTKRIATLLQHCGTKVIFLDECHNLLNTGDRSASTNLVAFRWLKSLVNNCGICVCLSGTPESEAIVDSDLSHQLTRRFKYRFRIEPLTPGSVDRPGALYYFLTQMCTHIRDRFSLQHMPLIANYPDTLRVYAATHGNLAFVMTLIKDTLQYVWRREGTSVSLEDFAAVWDTGIMSKASIAKRNPFRLSEGALAGEFRA